MLTRRVTLYSLCTYTQSDITSEDECVFSEYLRNVNDQWQYFLQNTHPIKLYVNILSSEQNVSTKTS